MLATTNLLKANTLRADVGFYEQFDRAPAERDKNYCTPFKLFIDSNMN